MGTYKQREKALKFLIAIVFIPICIVMGLPLWIVFVASFTKDSAISDYGYQLWPPEFSLDAYKYLIGEPELILRAYGVTISATIVGTLIGVFIMTMLAYAISHKDFKFQRFANIYVFFPMLFSGGVVPYYILITRYLHLKNNILVLILPLLVSPFFVLLLRTYLKGLPRELFEAAKIDGAGEVTVFFRVALPLSLPAIATVSLFMMLVYWNDMYQALLFIDNQNLYPLPYLLYQIVYNTNIIQEGSQYTGTVTPYQSTRMAMAVLAIFPVLFSFAFIQRFFIRGITLGGLKG
jgi:putative aldouronate transport system permease protein